MPYVRRKPSSMPGPSNLFHSAVAASLDDQFSMSAMADRSVAASAMRPARWRSSSVAAMATLIVEAVQAACPVAPARHTAPVPRSSTTMPSCPGRRAR